MKAPNITKGPWGEGSTEITHNSLGQPLGTGFRVQYEGSGHKWHVATVFGQMDTNRPRETEHGYAEANAKAIAALPNLLDTLEACLTEEGAHAFDNPQAAQRRLIHINQIVTEALLAAGYTKE